MSNVVTFLLQEQIHHFPHIHRLSFFLETIICSTINIFIQSYFLGAIGRRYRRADEQGTPFCITVDYESLDDDSVTIRSRDSMEQIRIKIDDLFPFLSKEIDGF